MFYEQEPEKISDPVILLNTPVEDFDVSVRLILLFRRLHLITFLDFLSLMYKGDPALERFGTKSRKELVQKLSVLGPRLIESLPVEWQIYYDD